jgi:iron complex outermembrane receptor protein
VRVFLATNNKQMNSNFSNQTENSKFKHCNVRRLILAFLLAFSIGQIYAQFSIHGKVENSEREALPGATIQSMVPWRVLASDKNGAFEIDEMNGNQFHVKISFIGYQSLDTLLNLSRGINKAIFTLKPAENITEDVVVSATRAGGRTPMAFTNLDVKDLPDKHSGQDLPYLLGLTPSLVMTSDAGTGIGYTNFRIRGSDANRINMTVNGIPLNDAESHTVYFVDMPDFAASTENIQVQRGVGSSTNGAGAFGGTVNIQTNDLNQKSYAGWSSAAGSFGTLKNTFSVGSGLLDGKFIFEARLSKISSNGYVERASSNLRSFYLTGGYLFKTSILKAIVFSGNEKTYQAWNGVPSSMLESNRTYNPSGMIIGKNGLVSYYDNETDNYQQDHYQLHFTHQFNNHLSANISLHYTYGRGYYEEYRQNQSLIDYQMKLLEFGGTEINKTDLVRRKWLDNDFFGTIGSLSYKKEKTELILGAAWNTYAGTNYGKVIWAQFYGDFPTEHEWYRSKGNKKDFNFFSKWNYQISKNLSIYSDLQGRLIDYKIEGIDDDLRDLGQRHHFFFMNPKAGAFYSFNNHDNLYFSYGIAHREPNRSNYTDADPSQPMPTHEKLGDFELGYKRSNLAYTLGVNLYRMDYKDQLILTGRINDVGAAIMTNVPKSYRMGLEYTGKLSAIKNIVWEHHATFSRNKIVDFVEYTDDWDHWGEQIINRLGTTDIAYSPTLVAGSNITWKSGKSINISMQTNFVSRQYLDNTSSRDRSLDSYFVNNLKLDYTLQQKLVKKWTFYGSINNFLNHKYESNGWVYSYYSEGVRKKEDGYFPQAGISYLLGMYIEF